MKYSYQQIAFGIVSPTLLRIFGVLHYVPNVASLGFGELRKQNLHSLLHKTSAFSVYNFLTLTQKNTTLTVFSQRLSHSPNHKYSKSSTQMCTNTCQLSWFLKPARFLRIQLVLLGNQYVDNYQWQHAIILRWEDDAKLHKFSDICKFHVYFFAKQLHFFAHLRTTYLILLQK